MEEEGWYSYHEQKADGSGHVLVITDTTAQLKSIAQGQIRFHGAGTNDELNKIVHWSADRRLAPSRFTAVTDDYKAPNVPKQSNILVRTEHGSLPSQLEVYEYTGAYTYSKQDQGDRQARVQVEQCESGMKRFSGASGVRSLPVGEQKVTNMNMYSMDHAGNVLEAMQLTPNSALAREIFGGK